MDDYASLLATLDGRMPRGDIAAAIGVEERELEEIASGYVPDEEIGERLRALAASGTSRRVMRIPGKWIVAFVIVDAIFFAGVAAYVLLR